MNEHYSAIVLKQLVANQYFPGAIVKYLETTDLKDLSGDALILLVNVFDERTVAAASLEFTQKLIDAMDGIVEDTMLDAMVSIFCVLMPYLEKTKPENNIVLNTFISDEQFYKSKIIYLANKGSMYRLEKILQTVAIMMQHPKTKENYFTENDYDVLVDLCLRELEQSNHEKARIQIFKVLYLILCEPIYIENPNYTYRIDMYKTKLENVIIHEEDESPYAVKERINIMRINMKLNQLCQLKE